jgi:hypothetical protein
LECGSLVGPEINWKKLMAYWSYKTLKEKPE